MTDALTLQTVRELASRAKLKLDIDYDTATAVELIAIADRASQVLGIAVPDDE